MKPPLNTDEHGAAQPQPKRISPQRRRERGGSALGAHASSFQRGWVSNTLHAGCVRSQEPAEENPWQLANDFGLVVQIWVHRCSSVVSHSADENCGFAAPCSSCVVSGETDTTAFAERRMSRAGAHFG